ncbi:hypothetical protein VE04_10020, partial [Pseudogymnoascus sp. 24MN13]
MSTNGITTDEKSNGTTTNNESVVSKSQFLSLDGLADSGLDAFDKRVPAAKKETKELYDEARELALTPYTLSKEGSDFVWKTYEGEVKPEDAKGVIGYSRAVVGTGFVVGGE